MPLIPCRDHAARIKALEDQVAALLKLQEGTLGLTTGILEHMEKPELPGPDPSLESYHR